MKRYFFDFFDGSSWRRDISGQEMQCVDDVLLEARESLVSLLPAYLSNNSSQTLCFSIRDAANFKVMSATITFGFELASARLPSMEECLLSLQVF